MLKLITILSVSIGVSACGPDQSSQQTIKAEVYKRERAVVVETPNESKSADQVKIIAKEYGVSEDRVNDVASRAAELSGGNASKQDMIDALKAATGK